MDLFLELNSLEYVATGVFQKLFETDKTGIIKSLLDKKIAIYILTFKVEEAMIDRLKTQNCKKVKINSHVTTIIFQLKI